MSTSIITQAVDGVSEANRATWSRLTRLHLASAGLPMRTTFLDAGDRRGDEPVAH